MIESRASLRRESDYMYTMAVARRRWRREDRHGLSFRQWARKTYNTFGACGKLRRILETGGLR